MYSSREEKQKRHGCFIPLMIASFFLVSKDETSEIRQSSRLEIKWERTGEHDNAGPDVTKRLAYIYHHLPDSVSREKKKNLIFLSHCQSLCCLNLKSLCNWQRINKSIFRVHYQWRSKDGNYRKQKAWGKALRKTWLCVSPERLGYGSGVYFR